MVVTFFLALLKVLPSFQQTYYSWQSLRAGFEIGNEMKAYLELKKPEMERIERILGNQPANLPKLKKEIESLIVEKSTPAIDNNSVKLKSANSSHVIKIENNLVQINKIDDCLVIKILNSSNDSTNYICQNENNEWKFQNK